jgi:hypothetical protein
MIRKKEGRNTKTKQGKNKRKNGFLSVLEEMASRYEGHLSVL